MKDKLDIRSRPIQQESNIDKVGNRIIIYCDKNDQLFEKGKAVISPFVELNATTEYQETDH